MAQEVDDLRDQMFGQLQEAEALVGTPLETVDWHRNFTTLADSMSIGASRTFTDTPDQDAVGHHMPDAIRDLLATAKQELLITNAYIIPDEKFLERLADLVKRGVKVRILTNSLATHDVPAVNSHYKQWREPLLKAGIDLYEMRPDASIRQEIADRAPVTSGFMGLHTKAIVVDRERAFIGSMNLDPRSIQINSEMGVIIDSPELAEKLAAVMLRDMAPENSWRVVLSPNGELRWRTADEVLDIQPARDFLQRVEDQFFMMFPKDYY
jgi:putative cardiolipin synthase